MTTLDRYVVLTFVRSYLILLAVGIGLYVVSDLIINLDEFTENRAFTFIQVVGMMADYYGHNLPLYFTQLGGPVMAFAGAYTLAQMLRNNEMTALVAAGMPLQRIAAPIIVCCIGVVGLWMVNRECVLPAFASKIVRQHDDLTGLRATGIAFARDDNDAILTARRIHLVQQQLDYVVIVEPPSQGGNVIQADTATYDAKHKTWRLEGGRRILVGAVERDNPDLAAIDRQPIAEYAFTLSPEELLLRQSSQWAGMLSLGQMNTLLKSPKLPNLAAVRMQRHIWLTQPLLQMLLLLLTLPFFLRREPGSVLVAGGRALVLSGLFFGVAFVAQNVISTQWAAIVAWIPILLFGPIAVVQMANVRT